MCTEREKARVKRWAKKWRANLLLQHWTVNITFDPVQESTNLVKADMDTNAAYLEVEINIYPLFWEDPINAQERTVLHELVHVLVAPLKMEAYKGRTKTSIQRSKSIQQQTETLTEHITNLLWDVYEER